MIRSNYFFQYDENYDIVVSRRVTTMHICSKKHWLALVLEIECPPVHHPGTVSSEHYLVMKMTTMMIMIDNGDDGDNDDYD